MHKKLALLLGLACASVATQAQQPPPVNTPVISLNNRIFLAGNDHYDATYGLLRIGYFTSDNVFHWLLPRKGLPAVKFPTAAPLGFKVYHFTSDKGYTGNVSIPVIGSAHASQDQVVYADMEDINEITLDRTKLGLDTCAVWAMIQHDQVPAGATVMLTDHAILSKVSYGAADKQDGSAKVSLGNFFSASGDLYKSSANDQAVPLISVSGGSFVVADPKAFCKDKAHSVMALHQFSKLSDLTKAKNVSYRLEKR